MRARTTKKERNENARIMYQTLMNSGKQAVLIERGTGQNNSCQFKAVVFKGEEPRVIASGRNLGAEECFIELFDALGAGRQVTMFEQGFNEWVYKTFKFRITYNDGMIMIFER